MSGQKWAGQPFKVSRARQRDATYLPLLLSLAVTLGRSQRSLDFTKLCIKEDLEEGRWKKNTVWSLFSHGSLHYIPSENPLCSSTGKLQFIHSFQWKLNNHLTFYMWMEMFQKQASKDGGPSWLSNMFLREQGGPWSAHTSTIGHRTLYYSCLHAHHCLPHPSR